MGKVGENFGVELDKSKSKKQVIDEARTAGATVHFPSLMDICHLKNAELEAKHQKYKGWVVLRGDIVKDDSGSYAVFTEQGSSASQMNAAKIMDIIGQALTKIRQNLRAYWKLMNPQECVWEIRYRIIMKTILQEKVKIHYSTTICFTNLFLCLKLWKFLKQKQQWQGLGKLKKWKWKMLTNYWKFQNRSVQTFGFVYHDTNGQNHGPVWKTQSFLLNEICMVIL